MSPRQRLRVVLSDEEKALRTALMIVRQQKGYVSRLGGWRRRTALALESLEAVERRLEHHAEQARLSREYRDLAAQPPSAGPWTGRRATNTPTRDSQATEEHQ